MPKQLTDAEIERVKQVYAETGSLSATARRCQVGLATVSKYRDLDDGFESLRNQKRAAVVGDIAAELAEVRQLYLDHLKRPEVIAVTSARDAAVIVGVTTDKHQLVSGGATERIEHVSLDEARDWVFGRVEQVVARRAGTADPRDASGRGADDALGLGRVGTRKPTATAG